MIVHHWIINIQIIRKIYFRACWLFFKVEVDCKGKARPCFFQKTCLKHRSDQVEPNLYGIEIVYSMVWAISMSVIVSIEHERVIATYLKNSCSTLLAPKPFLHWHILHLFIYLFIYLIIYLFIYLFIYILFTFHFYIGSNQYCQTYFNLVSECCLNSAQFYFVYSG